MKSRNRGSGTKVWGSASRGWICPPADTDNNTDADRRPGGGRRAWSKRRRRVWWSVVYGNFNPRRRGPQRRIDDGGFQSRDWHAAHLLAVAIGILLLSVADAFMTVTLLAGGAVEVNPVMAAVVYDSAALFAVLKMSLTGVGVILMVLLARYRFMHVIRVEAMLYAIFAGYAGLLCYEFGMLQTSWDLP